MHVGSLNQRSVSWRVTSLWDLASKSYIQNPGISTVQRGTVPLAVREELTCSVVSLENCFNRAKLT